jgi:hypothetical protein
VPRKKAASSARVTDPFDIATRVFLSYRREDSGIAVQHLRDSLGRLIGEDKIFRDADSIPLGKNFETVIGDAIRAASVCLVIIGPNWLTVARNGRRRLDEPEDYVRIEVESALGAGIEVIPVLVDGATMPDVKGLPKSIVGLAKLNGQELPWQTAIAKLGARIDQIERKRLAEEEKLQQERDRLDLTGGKRVRRADWKSDTAIASFNVVIRVMELSLARRGLRVFLSPTDQRVAEVLERHRHRYEFPAHQRDATVRNAGSFPRAFARGFCLRTRTASALLSIALWRLAPGVPRVRASSSVRPGAFSSSS